MALTFQKISIIIPTYNSSSTLERCLESMAIQTFRDFEVLIMDGVSKDDTLLIAQSFTDKIPSLRILSEPDKGIYDAMNKGIRAAKGEWLFFLGSDDWLYESNTLEQVAAQLDDRYEMVYGNVYRSYMENPVWGEEFDLYLLTKKNICHQGIFYRKSIFDKIGVYDLAYKVMADYLLNLRLFLDKGIAKRYMNVTVAHFSKGGLSSLGLNDSEQIRARTFLLSQKGTFRWSDKIELCGEILNFDLTARYLSTLRKWQYKSMVYFYLIGKKLTNNAIT